MRTIAYPRRVIRPRYVPKGMEHQLPEPNCKWCGSEIEFGVPCTLGFDLGKKALICSRCVTPPVLGTMPKEITVED